MLSLSFYIFYFFHLSDVHNCTFISFKERNLWKPPRVCPAQDLSFKKKKNSTNKAIDGHVIVNHKVVSLPQCGDFCIREPRCSAFNLATFTDHEGKMECQLIDNVKNIVNKNGFGFWLFDRESYKEVM